MFKVLVLAVAALLAQGLSSALASASAGETSRVSVATGGAQAGTHCFFAASGPCMFPSISADGLVVAFASQSGDLVPNDTNGGSDVFVHDRSTGETVRVSIASDGSQADRESYRTSISADGRYVAFDSIASNLVSGDTNGQFDIFVHDRTTRQTVRASVASDGTQAESSSFQPSISSDGRYVAFESEATTLVPGDTNRIRDIFLHELSSGSTSRVSLAWDGAQAAGCPSVHASLSAHGTHVAFQSCASNLVPGDGLNRHHIYLREIVGGTTRRVSVASDGTLGNSSSAAPSISADGRYVAFHSFASNLTAVDMNFTADVFVHDLSTAITQLVSATADGAAGNGGSTGAAISGDGRFVAFVSAARNLVPDDTNGVDDVFAYDRAVPAMARVSVASDGAEANGSSGASFRQLPLGVSANGRSIVFESYASNLVTADTNNGLDVFVHDQVVSPFDSTAPVTVASLTPAPNASGWNAADVSVGLAATDGPDGSGVREITFSASGAQSIQPTTMSGANADITITVEGVTTVAFHATDNVGNMESEKTVVVRIDRTAPTITFSGNADTYTVDQAILITCAARDDLSGIATTSCPDLASGPATNFVGTTRTTSTTLTAVATDNAGNSTSASTTFIVTVTADGICRLSAALALADDICTKVTSIATAPNAASRAAKAKAFDNFLSAQSGKSIPADTAALLSRLAHLL